MCVYYLFYNVNKSTSWIRKHWDKTSRKQELISFDIKKRTYYCSLLSFLNLYVLWNILSLFSWVHEWTKETSSRKYLFTYLPKFCTSNGSIRIAPVTVKPEEVYLRKYTPAEIIVILTIRSHHCESYVSKHY